MLAAQKKSLLANREEIIINSRRFPHYTQTQTEKKGKFKIKKKPETTQTAKYTPPQLRGVATLCPCKITLLWLRTWCTNS